MRLILRSEDISGATSVVEQFTDRDTGGDVVIRIVGPPGGNGLIERKFALLYKLKNGDRSKHLVHGADAELCIGCISDLPGSVGHAPRLLKHDLSMMGDEDRPGKR